MTATLVNPQGLWLLAGLPVLWLLAWRNGVAVSGRRLIVATLLRSSVLALVALAVSDPAFLERSREVSVVYALDISRSVSSTFLRQALDWIGGANSRYTPAHVRYVVFAERARLLDAREDVLSVPVAGEPDSTRPDAIDQSASDLEQALNTAVFGFAPHAARRLVLVSDGNQTQGDVWRALPRLRAENVHVFTIPAAVSVDDDAWVDAIEVPDGVREEEPVTIRVRLFARTASAARLRVSTDARLLAARALRLLPGGNDVPVTVRFPRAGSTLVTAQVRADGDQDARNDELSESVWVGPRPRVLYVESAPESARYLTDALRAQHIEVTQATPAALGTDHGLLAGQDAVILSDVEAGRIDAATAAALERFVRDDGRGLIFAAGERTYGKHGYAGSRVEQLLPVRFQGKRKRRDLDLVLLIDRSYSMRGHKLELAKSAALATLDLLDKHHRLAVVGFDSRPHEVVPLAEVGGKRRAEDQISGMTASGQTNIYNALADAEQILAGSTAATRHIILLSDGITAPPPGTATDRSTGEEAQERVREARAETLREVGGRMDPEPQPQAPIRPGGMQGLVDELAAEKVTLSTIAIGEKPNLDLMRDLAARGKGRSYVASSDAEIPSLFVAETRRLLGEAIVEEPFHPKVVRRTQSIAGMDFSDGPPLRGFVVARPKPFSEVLLQASGERPLLVQTHYGLGKTVAFLSDVKNRWAAQWLPWDGYGRFWAQVVRDTIPRSAGEGMSWHVSRAGREALIEMRALAGDHTYRDGLTPKVRISAPDGEATVVTLRQVAPGDYRASAPVQQTGGAPYRFELLRGGGLSEREVAAAGTRSLTYPWPDEFRMLPANMRLLKALSERTDGVFEPKEADIFADRGDGAMVARPLWPWLVAAALLLFLLDVFVRRAPWPDWLRRLRRQAYTHRRDAEERREEQ